MEYIDKSSQRQLSQRSDLWGAWLVFHVWAVIGLAVYAGITYPVLIPLCVLIIGSRQHGLAILMHDCAHAALFKNRAINDFVGQYVLAGPYGGDMLAYRRYHLQHHKFTQSEDDPDLPLSAKFPVSKQSLRRKFIRDITGQTFLRLLMARRKKTNVEGSDAFKRRSPWPMIVINVAMFAGLTAMGAWWAYFVLWLLPLTTWFFAVLRLRNIAEHAMTTTDDNPLTHARTTHANVLERIFFAPYWVNYHVEHHAYMYVPCFRLKALHKMMTAQGYDKAMEMKDSYVDVMRHATIPQTTPA